MTRRTRPTEASPARSAVVMEALEGRTLFSAMAVAVGDAPAVATHRLMQACSNGTHYHNPQTFQIISAGSNGKW